MAIDGVYQKRVMNLTDDDIYHIKGSKKSLWTLQQSPAAWPEEDGCLSLFSLGLESFYSWTKKITYIIIILMMDLEFEYGEEIGSRQLFVFFMIFPPFLIIIPYIPTQLFLYPALFYILGWGLKPPSPSLILTLWMAFTYRGRCGEIKMAVRYPGILNTSGLGCLLGSLGHRGKVSTTSQYRNWNWMTSNSISDTYSVTN